MQNLTRELLAVRPLYGITQYIGVNSWHGQKHLGMAPHALNPVNLDDDLCILLKAHLAAFLRRCEK